MRWRVPWAAAGTVARQVVQVKDGVRNELDMGGGVEWARGIGAAVGMGEENGSGRRVGEPQSRSVARALASGGPLTSGTQSERHAESKWKSATTAR